MSPIFTNPVYNSSSADPFVLKYCGEYWAYCTGIWPDGRCFGILHSKDLVNWRDIGGALDPLPGNFPCYWAPEVHYENGIFYLYYSVGNETHMEIRVATSETPGGPFHDSGHRLTDEEFAIDAHVFEDDDGRRYLFYATDFLTHTHIGTGTVMRQLISPTTLGDKIQIVSRARYDWQVYDPARKEKGGVRWHTVEGPFVLKYKGLYYQMFSGGNWQNVTYGVSYAYSPDLFTPNGEEWQQVCDGQEILPILRTLPGLVIGPGHNSVVRGLDNRENFCVYHRWNESSKERVMCIDRLDWCGKRMVVLGPSVKSQPAPNKATIGGFEHLQENAGVEWPPKTTYSVDTSGAFPTLSLSASGKKSSDLVIQVNSSYFLFEISYRFNQDVPAQEVRFRFGVDKSDTALLTINSAERRFMLHWLGENEWREQVWELPEGFNLNAYHLLRVEAREHVLRLSLEETSRTSAAQNRRTRWEGYIDVPIKRITLSVSKGSAHFAGLEITEGWEDRFESTLLSSPQRFGWSSNFPSDWRVEHSELTYVGALGEGSYIWKDTPFASYSCHVSARLLQPISPPTERYAVGPCYGVFPAFKNRENTGPLISVEYNHSGWALKIHYKDKYSVHPLPTNFDPLDAHYFELRKEEDLLTIRQEGLMLGSLNVKPDSTRVALFANSPAAFDKVSVTRLS